MSRYHEDIPNPAEVADAVNEVFASAAEAAGDAVLRALVPLDTTMEPGRPILNYAVNFELGELLRFVEYFSRLAEHEADRMARARLQVLVYCHVLEADLPLTVVWNLHRLLRGDAISWTFHRVTRRGKTEVCRFPSQRIEEIQKLSEEGTTNIGELLAKTWRGNLRNGFSHSGYFFAGQAVTCTGRLTPITREGTGIRENGSTSYTFKDVQALYGTALTFLENFIGNYDRQLNCFKDGRSHPIAEGRIAWDKTRDRWVWSG